MFGSVKKFQRDRKGAFAIQFALMVVPLTVCTGLAIDGGRAFLARFELESALDAAALAVGSTYQAGANLDNVAQTFVDANFKSPHSGPISLTLTPGDDVLKLKGDVTINTYFMPLVGQNTVTVSAESEVRRGGGNVEVALALDITQSMSGSKITALKQAAKDLVDTVVNDAQTPYFSKVALAPWGTNIHVSTYADAMRGAATGPATITAATWRSGTAKTITGGNWKKGAAVTSSVTANWRTGTEFTVSTVSKVSGRVRLTVTGTPTALVNGDTVGIYTPSSGSADGSFASYKNQAYKLANRSGTSTVTFDLQDLAGAYVAPPSGSTNGTSWRVTECLNASCQMRLSNSGTNNLVNGDYVHLTGFSSPYAALNNSAADGTWQVTSTPTAPTSTTAFINVVGPTLGNPNYTTGNATGGTIQECYTSTCEYAITAVGHGFATGDQVLISGTSISGGGATDIDNGTSPVTTWTIGDVTTDTFTLPGAGTSYANWSSSGTVSKCLTSACEVQVTAAGHGLANNDYVQITSVVGMTSINNSGTEGPSSAWQVKNVSGNNFVLSTSVGPSYSNYTSGGSSQCLKEGCQKYRYKSNATGTTSSPYQYQIRTISNCVTERTGTDAATDVAPSTSPLGRDYAGAGSLVGCQTANNIVPLTSDKTTIKDKIENMTVYGSTAGEIGAAWAWYMLSPNWGYLWPADSNRPKAYDFKHLSKVAVLMTDGEFNTAHCNGVTSESYHVGGSVSDTDLIDTSVCTPAKAPFAQAQDICTAMKAKGIIVYTIGFQVGSEPGAADFLTACATDSSHVFLAADSNALKAAFKSIAKSITKLRISK